MFLPHRVKTQCSCSFHQVSSSLLAFHHPRHWLALPAALVGKPLNPRSQEQVAVVGDWTQAGFVNSGDENFLIAASVFPSANPFSLVFILDVLAMQWLTPATPLLTRVNSFPKFRQEQSPAPFTKIRRKLGNSLI
jgi:hypothetical protein